MSRTHVPPLSRPSVIHWSYPPLVILFEECLRVKKVGARIKPAALGTAILALAACAGALPASPADQAPPQTRAEQVMRARRQKAAQLKPETDSRLERIVERIVDDDGSVYALLFGNGFGLRFGGMRSGSGFALGPRFYRRDLAADKVVVETSLTASVRRYWSADAGLVLPNIGRKRFDAEFRVRHADAPSIDYFGPGPRSRKENRSNYRREDNMLSGALTWRPLRTVSAGWLTGANWVNIGPGRGHASPSTDNRFSRALIPGLQQQSGYMVNGPFLAFDSRDWPGDPHRGSLLSAAYLGYWNFSHRRSSFRRLEAQAEHYLPLFNQTRVIALRARTELSFVRDADEVPFYLQPVLGGPDDLRGFDRFRFHDNNSLLVNAEYRWEVSPALDLAVFADAGKVFERPGLVGLHHLEASGGLGFRLKTRNLVVMRLDTAVSREGFRLWLQFSNAFDGLPLFR